jgi:hypothetical protein
MGYYNHIPFDLRLLHAVKGKIFSTDDIHYSLQNSQNEFTVYGGTYTPHAIQQHTIQQHAIQQHAIQQHVIPYKQHDIQQNPQHTVNMLQIHTLTSSTVSELFKMTEFVEHVAQNTHKVNYVEFRYQYGTLATPLVHRV